MSEVLVHSTVNETGEEIMIQEKKKPANLFSPKTAQQLREIAISYMYQMLKYRPNAKAKILLGYFLLRF